MGRDAGPFQWIVNMGEYCSTGSDFGGVPYDRILVLAVSAGAQVPEVLSGSGEEKS